MDKKARDAIIRARVALIVEQPFYGTLSLNLQLVESTDPDFCDTMAVDGKTMWYWPKFVHKISESELIGVVAHEVSHCAYKHMSRRQGRDPCIWNIAGDLIINIDVLESGFSLPNNLTDKSQKMLIDAGFTLPKKLLHDPTLKGMSTEEVYELLKQRLPPQTIKIVIAVRDFGGTGSVVDAGDSSEKAKVEVEWEGSVRHAIAVAKAAGALPGHLQRLIGELEQPRVSWREIMRRFIDQSMATDYSMKRPSRRYLSKGLLLPGMVADGIHHLVVFVDDSGSVNGPMLTAFISEAAGALDSGVCDCMTIVYADTAVHQVDEFERGDLVTAREIKGGGGGTCFVKSFEWLKEHAPDASCALYLTDMCTMSFGEDPGIPVLWGAYASKQVLSQYKPGFGEVVEVDTSDW